MKNFLLLLLTFTTLSVVGQSKNIVFKEKNYSPIQINGKEIKVGDIVRIEIGTNPDGSYRFIQLLNSFNESMDNATSRMSMMKQPIKFFKTRMELFMVILSIL